MSRTWGAQHTPPLHDMAMTIWWWRHLWKYIISISFHAEQTNESIIYCYNAIKQNNQLISPRFAHETIANVQSMYIRVHNMRSLISVSVQQHFVNGSRTFTLVCNGCCKIIVSVQKIKYMYPATRMRQKVPFFAISIFSLEYFLVR